MTPSNTLLLRLGRRAAYLATCLGFLGGYWLSGWSLRAKNKKMKQKYEKEIAVRDEEIELWMDCMFKRVCVCVWVDWVDRAVESWRGGG